MTNKKSTDTLPSLNSDQLTDVWGGANRQAAIAERERIKDMKRPFVRSAPGLDRVVKG
jgi:hypothetical protein